MKAFLLAAIFIINFGLQAQNQVDNQWKSNVNTIFDGLSKQVVSGTFFFDIIDQNGDLRQIRDGRFDMQFTQ